MPAADFRISMRCVLGCKPIAALGGVLPQGPIGAANLKIMYNALAILMAIVLPTIVARLAFAEARED